MSFLFGCCFNKIFKNLLTEEEKSPSFFDNITNEIKSDIKINKKKKQLRKEMEERKKVRDKRKYELLSKTHSYII